MRRLVLPAALLAALLFGTVLAQAEVIDLRPHVVTVYPYYPTYAVDQIPYFAEHPPVYYGYAVPRPYGWSPFPLEGSHLPPAPAPAAPAPGPQPSSKEAAPAPAQAVFAKAAPARKGKVKTVHFTW